LPQNFEDSVADVQQAETGPAALPAVDLSQISPEMIDYVLKGGQVPGVPRETVDKLIAQYLRQKPSPARTAERKEVRTQPLASSGDSVASLPPLDNVPPEFLKHVMSGGLIPGYSILSCSL